jgi:hypothetical protein
MPPMLMALDSIDTGAHIANRFAKLKDLPEHPLFPQIHARLAMGENPFSVSKWVQAVVPPADLFSPASMPLRTLNSRLRRYSALLPMTAKVPKSYIDELTKGLAIEIDVVAELAASIVYQKARISQFAPNEKAFPLGITSEQQRKEVVTLTDMLMKMRDTQIAFGLVPGVLPGSPVTNQVIAVGADFSGDDDPLSQFLANNPSAIPRVMEAFDALIAEGAAERDTERAARDLIDSRNPSDER